MRYGLQKIGILLAASTLTGVLSLSSAFAAGKADTFTGQVSDAMCGAKHMMAGNPAECTRACIGKGSKYALVVGDKVYTLETKNKSALDSLNKLAGEQATVTGKLNGETIEVSSVASGQ
jgi:hypothetical protein